MFTPKKETCPDRKDLLAFSMGNVSAAKFQEIADHLAHCDTCLSILEECSQSGSSETDDSVLRAFRATKASNDFLDEPECRKAVGHFCEIGPELNFPVPPQTDRADSDPLGPLPVELARYRLLEQIGQGGMGTVYRATDTLLDREVAIKIPHFPFGSDPEVRRRFQREARAAASLEHPNVCPVHDVGGLEDTPYLAMALIRGRPLSRLLKQNGPFPPREAADLVRKLALAVAMAHEKGIVHRDIKPSNIMIDEKGEPILTDFGLVQRHELYDPHLTRSGTLVGTPSYMAPEQAGDDPEVVGPASDVYSLGVVLYELLTGEVPFQGPLLSVLSQLTNTKPPMPSRLRSGLDKSLEAICLKALEKQPEHRHQSATELAEALDHYLQTDPRSAEPPKRRWWLALGGAAAFILAALVLLHVKTDKGTLVLKVNQPGTEVTVDGDQVHLKSPSDEVSMKIKNDRLTVNKEGFRTNTEAFTIQRENEPLISAKFRPKDQKLESLADPMTGLGTLLLTIPNPSPHGDDGFGESLYTIGGKILVGAPQATRFGAGAAYLFDGSARGIYSEEPLATFKRPGGGTNDSFGASLAACGSVVLITEPHDATHFTLGGSAHLFDISGKWLPPSLDNPSPAGREAFGNNVVCVGNHFIITSHGDTRHGVRETGAAYVYKVGEREPAVILDNPTPESIDNFGTSIAPFGEDKVLIGCFRDDTGANDAGSAYLFDVHTGKLLATFPNPEPAHGDNFGVAVAVVGDKVVVGAHHDRADGPDAGIAFLFDGSGPYDESPREPILAFHNPNGDRNGTFGYRLATIGDCVLIGAIHDSTAGNDAGAAYLFDMKGKLVHQFLNPTPESGDFFSSRLASFGNHILISAKRDRSNGNRGGVVYLFQGMSNLPTLK